MEKLKLDVDFINFYVKKKYRQDLNDYYSVTPSVASKWKHSYFPDSRLHEFAFKEGTTDVIELIKRIYQ
jgi:hypothetical protein